MSNQKSQALIKALTLIDGSGNRQLEAEPEAVAKVITAATVKSSVEIARSCPDPKREDIYKILAIQGHCLNEYGLLLLRMASNSTHNKPFYIDYGLKLTKEAKDVFRALLRDPGFDPSPPPKPGPEEETE